MLGGNRSQPAVEQPGGGQRLAPDQPRARALTSRHTDLPRGSPAAISLAPVTVLIIGG